MAIIFLSASPEFYQTMYNKIGAQKLLCHVCNVSQQKIGGKSTYHHSTRLKRSRSSATA